ncbi:uncharacterized protein LOC125945562 [Dermacentor silvarum]|uniref:uncharacterized protein LOC125945562 n=1 Tax=Dermacentor silvarum TaxID=543639 RepID=UPI00210198CB|nr:uncharacterized protein LOC125945562 [Dermacentor silvarum]
MLSEPNGTRMLAPFEENGVAHYGMLTDWSGWSYNVMHHRATLDLFRVLRQYQRQRDAGRPFLLGGIVYAVKMLPSYNREQLDIFDHIVKDFKVDMLVATTHMEQTYQYTLDCKITGPTTWDKKYDPHELPIADVIKQLSDRRYLDLDIPVAVSFTLKGFWYKPEKNEDDSDFAPGKPCGYIVGGETFGSYTEVCENTTYRKQMTSIEEGHFFNYTFYREYDRTFVFDTLSSITQKVVLAHRAHRGLSFALFDIDYEDVFDQCPGNLYGAFDRVAAVRWLTDRFKEIQEAAVIGGPESTAS